MNALLPRSTGQTFLSQLALDAGWSGPASPNVLLAAALLNAQPSGPDAYLRGLLRREAVDTSPQSDLRMVEAILWPIIQTWANSYLLGVTPSGSFSKGTANASGTDIDLFISISPNAVETLRQIYDTLERALQAVGYATRRQNVSINITVGRYSVDLVPAKRQHLQSHDHSLYRRKVDSWTKTNVLLHAAHVGGSGRTEEIRILKLWRDQWGLDFPSFYLELVVLRALGPLASYGDVSANVWTVFQFLRDGFSGARIADPANTNNIISDDLTAEDKRRISAAAHQALSCSNWSQIVV